MPTIGELFGTWAEEQARLNSSSPIVRDPPLLGPPPNDHRPVALYANDVYSLTRGGGDVYALQLSRQAIEAALLTHPDPCSAEAGMLRRRLYAIDAALRGRGAPALPDNGFAAADVMKLYQALGIKPERRRRRDEEDSLDDIADIAGSDGGGE